MHPGHQRSILRRRLLVVAGFAFVSMATAGCFGAQAKTTGPGPIPLTVPVPPERLQIPVEAEPPAPAPVAEKPAVPNTTTKPPRPTPTPAPTPAPATPPSSTTETTPPPVVQTGAQAEQETRANQRMAAAVRDLGRLQRDSLGRDAQEQFDAAQKFVRLTRDALTARNYVYAAYCADKAATLAALLVKREPASALDRPVLR